MIKIHQIINISILLVVELVVHIVILFQAQLLVVVEKVVRIPLPRERTQ